MSDIPHPGSDKAIDAGCTCPVLDNGHGRGYLGASQAWTRRTTMSDARRKALDELTALTERLGLYNEPTRVGDEASVALSHAFQELRWVEAERDRYLKALKDIRYMSHYKAAQFYPSAVEQVLALHRIAREALAGTEDDT